MAIQDYLAETLRTSYEGAPAPLREGGLEGFAGRVNAEQQSNIPRGGELNQDVAIGNLMMGKQNDVLDRLGSGLPAQPTSPFAPQPGSGTGGTGGVGGAAPAAPSVSKDAIAEMVRQGITDPQAQVDYLNANSGGGRKFSISDLYSSTIGSGAPTNYGQELRYRIDEAFSQFKPKTEAEIIQEQMDQVQAQIDVINAAYDRQLTSARREGQGRLGQVRGLNQASGTTFDPFGATRVMERTDQNAAIETQIERERLAEVANAMAAARGEATGRIERQADRLAQIANQEVNALAQAFNLSAEEAQNIRSEAIQRAQITGMIDGDPTLGLRAYLADEAQRQVDNTLARDEFGQRQYEFGQNLAQDQARIEIAKQEAERAGYQLEQLADGTLGYFDRDTRQFVSLGNYAKPTSGGGSGGSGSSGTPNSVIESLAASILNGETDYDYIEITYGPNTARDVDNFLRTGSFGGGAEEAPVTETPNYSMYDQPIGPQGQSVWDRFSSYLSGPSSYDVVKDRSLGSSW